MEPTHTEDRLPGEEPKKRRVNVGESERNASLAGGAALALSGLRALTKRHYLPGLSMMVAGGLFMYRGKTGHCDLYQAMGVDTVSPGSQAVSIEKQVTINRPPQEVYDFWRNLENLPLFMKHLESVQVTGAISHWKALGLGGVAVEWDAEMTNDDPGRQISWRSIGEAKIPNQGSVEFRPAPGERGTEVRVSMEFHPPGGIFGKAAARLAHPVTAQQMEEDLKRLKQILETGQVATSARTLH